MATACNFWPAIEAAIKTWFAGQNDTTPPTRSELGIDPLVCNICHTSELSIAEFQPNMDEDAVVLACGHLIGYDCMQEWATACRRQNQPLGCPLCRSPLAPRRCNMHQVRCINLAVDEPFAVVVDKIHNVMLENARSQEETNTCEYPGCMGSARRRERIEHAVSPEIRAYIASISPWDRAWRQNEA